MTSKFKYGLLIQIKMTMTDKHEMAKGWLRLLNKGDHLIQVANTKFVWMKTRDYENWSLIGGGCLIQGCLGFSVEAGNRQIPPPVKAKVADCAGHEISLCVTNFFV